MCIRDSDNTVFLRSGDKVSFDWKAAGGSDAYDVYGYIVNVADNSFVKILDDQSSDASLGMHIIGARAADLIAEGVTAMEFRASAEDIARISHSHPTYAEAIKEAALAATENRPLHI